MFSPGKTDPPPGLIVRRRGLWQVVTHGIKSGVLLAQPLTHRLKGRFERQYLPLLTGQSTVQRAHSILQKGDLTLEVGAVSHTLAPKDLHADVTLHSTYFSAAAPLTMPRREPSYRPVYSTEKGRLCPQCQRGLRECVCGVARPAYLGDGIVRIRRETKGRGGKAVTVIEGLPVGHDELKDLCKRLKQRCGTGGSVKGVNLEIQGDQRATCSEVLISAGFEVKLAGG